jgi:hypothetical protein
MFPDTPAGGPCVLEAKPLAGGYETLDAAAAVLRERDAAAYGWRGTTSTATAIREADAALIRVEETPPSDPRTAGSGAFHLALHAGGAWSVATTPLDIVNGAAGHTFVPEVYPASAAIVARPGATPRAVLRLVDITDAICDVCADRDRQTRTWARTVDLVVTCSLSGTPACTDPLEVEVGSTISSTGEDVLQVQPGPACQVTFPP